MIARLAGAAESASLFGPPADRNVRAARDWHGDTQRIPPALFAKSSSASAARRNGGHRDPSASPRPDDG